MPAKETFEHLLDTLMNVKRSGSNGNYTARCPGHDDKANSLSLTYKDGNILLKCFAGCELQEILEPLNIKSSELFTTSKIPPSSKPPVKTGSNHWNLVDRSGKVIATHYRTDFDDGSKQIWWKRNGISGLDGVKTSNLPLYGLQWLTPDTADCFIVEGEKAADSLHNIHLSVMGTVCGANVIPSIDTLQFLSELKGNIYLWPDNDDIGYKHMDGIAAILMSLGCNVFMINWVDAPLKGDAVDFLLTGGDIKSLINAALPYIPDDQPPISVAVDDPHEYNTTDTGNAERFVRDHRSNVHFCPERGRWMIWNGKFWEWDNKNNTRVLGLSKDTVRNMYNEAAKINDNDKRVSFVKFIGATESESRRRAMINLAVPEKGIVIAAGDTDTNNWLINCNNGTIDLKTGVLKPHNKSDLNTNLIDINFDPYAACPLWMDFLNVITSGDDDLQAYLQKAVGYSMTGDIREQCLFFLYGRGQNGKSTFINTILYILGPYAHQADMDIFMMRDKHVNGPKEGLANLQGRRFVAATELEEGRKLATATVKMVTGGEMITADRKHEHYISFWPTHKIWLSGNHKPRISDTTDSIWRRLKLIPFTNKIESPDEYLSEKLKKESVGILSWAVLGCQLWLIDGLKNSESITSATSVYRDDQDEIGEFVKEMCVINSVCKIYTAELYKDYIEWSNKNNINPLGLRRFNGKVEEKGFVKNRGTGNKLEWHGLGLKTLFQEGFDV